jgi:hypothetical protein
MQMEHVPLWVRLALLRGEVKCKSNSKAEF